MRRPGAQCAHVDPRSGRRCWQEVYKRGKPLCIMHDLQAIMAAPPVRYPAAREGNSPKGNYGKVQR